MHPADKAVLRLAIGLGAAVLVAYGLGMTAPFVACLLTVMILCKPGPPIPLVQGMVLAVVVGGVLLAGLLMVPLLEHYAMTGVLLTAALLYGVYFLGARSASPMTVILVIAFAAIPVAGVADQGFAATLAKAMAVGLAVGILVSGIWHALFPDPPGPAGPAAIPATVSPETARRAALQAMLVIMPVFILALSDPAHFFPAIVKGSALGRQAHSIAARSAGSELVGSTIAGALMAAVVWLGLSLWPSLWMLMLWMMAAAFWAGSRLFRVRATRQAPTFWSNALVTMLILLGPAIEDSAAGKDVLKGALTRTALFIGLAIYAWAIVLVFERWSTRGLDAPPAGTAGRGLGMPAAAPTKE
jgi:hypothetical protein